MHLFQGGVLLVFWILMVNNYCKGELPKTYSCVNYESQCGGSASSCPYNKLRNCQYYYIHCGPGEEVDIDSLQQCFDSVGRAPFSGCLDIRLLTSDICTRCEILKQDLSGETREDEFYLVDPQDSERQSCGGAQELSCVTTRAFGRECGCSDYQTAACKSASPPDSNPAPSAAPQARRLQGAPAPPPQPCGWAPSAPPDYSMDERHCSQPGSYVYRFSVLYIYLACVFWALLTLAGQAVRLLSKTEPWFFNPSVCHEGLGWRLLRLAGP